MPGGARQLHLSAVVCHHGWMHGLRCHYTALCWVSELGSWVRTDDAHVSLLSSTEAFDQAGRLGYLFFYQQPDAPSWFSIRQFSSWCPWPVMDWVAKRMDRRLTL
eukprot:1105146-Rhodomonas_salina.2